MITRRVFALGMPVAAVSVRSLRAAGIDGKWEAEVEGPMGPMALMFELKADGGALTGTAGNDMMGMLEIKDGKIEGDQVSFVQVMMRGDFEMRFKYEGKLMGDELELTRSMDRPAGGGPRPGGPGGPGGRGGRPGGGQGPGRRQGPGGGPGGGGGRRGGGMGRPVTFTATRVP